MKINMKTVFTIGVFLLVIMYSSMMMIKLHYLINLKDETIETLNRVIVLKEIRIEDVSSAKDRVIDAQNLIINICEAKAKLNENK